MTALLGGAASPVGWYVQYVEAPFGDVLSTLVDWRRHLGQSLDVSEPQPFPDVLPRLAPFQTPWTRELLMAQGTWTAYVNNFVNGGDPTASAAHIAALLDVRWAGAGHTLPYGPGHQSTQLQVEWPEDASPSRSARSVAVYQEDGRWSWEETGQALPFEQLDRYTARRKRDRLDRALLLDYLGCLGISADDDASLGPGVIVQQLQPDRGQRREVSLDEARTELGLPPLDL